MLSPLLVCGDNVRVIDTIIPDGSIDLVVTSPPYDDLRDYAVHSNQAASLCGWSPTQTRNGSETLTSMKQAIHFKEACGLCVHDTMIYHTNKPPLSHNRYDPAWEYMFVFSKGRPRVWNPIREPSKHAGQKRCSTMRQDGDELGNRSAKGRVRETKLLSNVWYLPRSSNTDGRERAAADKRIKDYVALVGPSEGIDISENYIALASKRLGL